LDELTENTIQKLPEKQRETAKEFIESQKQKGHAPSTRNNYATLWRTFADIDKKYDEMTVKDLKSWVLRVREHYSPSTANQYIMMTKRFFQWIYFGDDIKKGIYPPVVDWMSYKRGISHRSLPKTLSQDEIIKIIGSTSTLMEKALLFVTYDSGARAGEVLGLRIGDVKPAEYGARIRLQGKTGERSTYLIHSWPDLQQWLESHPAKRDATAALWPSSKKGLKIPITHSHADYVLKKAVRRAGVQGPVTLHMFRHSRATHLATKLTEAQLRLIFGWAPSSTMPSIYVHLSGRDSDKALLKAAGIEVEEDEIADRATMLRTCPRCRLDNGAASRFCNNCGMILDEQLAAEMATDSGQLKEIGARAFSDEKMARIYSDPEVGMHLDAIIDKISKAIPK